VVKMSVACLAVVVMFSGCGKKDDPTDDAITVANEQSLTQQVFADNISGNSLTSFTTTGPWTSSITETTMETKASILKLGTLEWISIDPSSGDKAGTYDVSIILEPNMTREDRTAVITISCKGEEIKITVTQKGVKEDGQLPSLTTLTAVFKNIPDEIKMLIKDVVLTGYTSGASGTEISLASVAFSNGFLMVLPATVMPEVLMSLNSLPAGVTVSNMNAKILFETYLRARDKDGEVIGSFYYGKGNSNNVRLYGPVYADNDVSIEGVVGDMTFRNVSLKKGWNLVFAVGGNVWTTQPQSGVKWYLQMPGDVVYD